MNTENWCLENSHCLENWCLEHEHATLRDDCGKSKVDRYIYIYICMYIIQRFVGNFVAANRCI